MVWVGFVGVSLRFAIFGGLMPVSLAPFIVNSVPWNVEHRMQNQGTEAILGKNTTETFGNNLIFTGSRSMNWTPHFAPHFPV